MTEIGKEKTLKRVILTRLSVREDACKRLIDWHEVLKTQETINDDCTENLLPSTLMEKA